MGRREICNNLVITQTLIIKEMKFDGPRWEVADHVSSPQAGPCPIILGEVSSVIHMDM